MNKTMFVTMSSVNTIMALATTIEDELRGKSSEDIEITRKVQLFLNRAIGILSIVAGSLGLFLGVVVSVWWAAALLPIAGVLSYLSSIFFFCYQYTTTYAERR